MSETILTAQEHSAQFIEAIKGEGLHQSGDRAGLVQDGEGHSYLCILRPCENGLTSLYYRCWPDGAVIRRSVDFPGDVRLCGVSKLEQL